MITTLPLGDIRRTEAAPAPRLHRGLDAAAHRAVGWWKRREAGKSPLAAQAARVHQAAVQWRTLNDTELNRKLEKSSAALRLFARRNLGAEVRDTALSLLCELAWRETGLRPHPEQIHGAMIIEQGRLAEMATGEGKTLTIGIAAALAGWRRVPCHVITANDYLVKRDATWLKAFYERCGLRGGFVTGGMDASARRAGYGADITYATSREVVADFLRDRLQLGGISDGRRLLLRGLLGKRSLAEHLVMRGVHTGIIDEADHVLIDEAVTPLIISRPAPDSGLAEACAAAAQVAEQLQEGTHFLVNRVFKDVDLLEAGRRRAGELLEGQGGIWAGESRREELVATALRAREFFRRGQQYIVGDDGKIVIVDEFTGRVMPDRTWRQGLQQAVEAKEGVPMTVPTETVARLSFQRYFRFYRKLSGVTGTASEAAEELWQIYRLISVPVPTHKPCIRKQETPVILATAEEKWTHVTAEIRDLHARGIPILAGTRSVEASEELAARLSAMGIDFQLLNARQHEREAHIVSGAGEQARVTIATNMAGRGTDIKLGAGVVALGGLHVIGTERHESQRVDRQLFGRSGRQGEPGCARMIVAMDDALIRRFIPGWIRKPATALVRRGIPGSRNLALALFHLAQRRAEAFSFRSRKSVLRQDEWVEESLAIAPEHGG